jgi:Gluconate 2-dehydrogenase subunit 3
MAAQIIPSDTPGAREAGAVAFIDRALSGFYGAHRAEFLADYEAFAQRSRGDRPLRNSRRELRLSRPARQARARDGRPLLRSRPRCMIAECHTTSLPVESNSVSIDPELKDAWGLPAMRATYRDHPHDLATSGRGQPTMTIQALAFRAGEHIAQFAKRGEI